MNQATQSMTQASHEGTKNAIVASGIMVVCTGENAKEGGREKWWVAGRTRR